MIVSSILILALLFVVLKKLGYGLTILHLLLLSFVLKAIGLFFIGEDSGEFKSFEYFSYFFMSFVAGLFLYSYINKNKISSIIRPKIMKVDNLKDLKLEYMIVSFILVAFALYHYSQVGVPLFNDDIEIARFQAASSGLLGIPSRIVNYSILFYFIYLLILFYLNFFNKKALLIYSIFPILLMLFAGSKSSIIVILHLIIASYRFSNFRIKFKHIIYTLLPVILYSSFVFSKFQTLQDTSILIYLVERLTIINANTFDYIIDIFAEEYTFGLGAGVINDLIYPFYKLIGQANAMTVNTMLSASFYNVTSGEFTVPVTPGIFGYYYLEFGFIGTLIFSFFSGGMYAIVYIKANQSITLMRKASFVFFEYMLFIAYGSGNPMYVIVNYTVGVLIIVMFFMFIKSFFQLLKNSSLIKIYYRSHLQIQPSSQANIF